MKALLDGTALAGRETTALGGVGSQEILAVRIDPAEEAEYLKKQHVKAMDFTGRPMKGFLYVKTPGFKTDAALEEWVERSIAYVSTIKKKAKRKKKLL